MRSRKWDGPWRPAVVALAPLLVACGGADDELERFGEHVQAACGAPKIAGHIFHHVGSWTGDLENQADYHEHADPGTFRRITFRTDGRFKARQVRHCSVDVLPDDVTPCDDWQRAGKYHFEPSACNRKRVVLQFGNGEERTYEHHFEDNYGPENQLRDVLYLIDGKSRVVQFARFEVE